MTFLVRATAFAAMVAMVAGDEIECSANGDESCSADPTTLLQAKVDIAAKTLTGDSDIDGRQLATKSFEVGAKCKATCWGQTCDQWAQMGKSCDELTGTAWGCDCSGCSSCNQVPAALATIPVVWQVIKTKTGKGHMSAEEINQMMEDVNKRFAGVDVDSWTPPKPGSIPAGPDVTGILASKSFEACSAKCYVALCYKKGTMTDAATKNKVKEECYCGDDFCKGRGFKYEDEKAMEKPSFWKVNKLYGNRLDTGIRFKVDSINYVTNDDWHHHCCCAHASKTYKPAQHEIFDKLIDKTTVRSKVTVITCEMKPKNGGGTAGQSSIAGGSSCPGGPGIMVDREALKPYTHAWAKFSNGEQADTLVHEFGHFLGLSHTFAETCSSGDWGTCKPEEICNPTVNKGDHVDDTPIHIKQAQCKMDASGETTADSCPTSPGKDPLDNFMSYSQCPARRFTQGQVARMHSTIENYFPAFLTKRDGRVAKDLPCDPEFPSKVIPTGYKRKSSSQTPAPSLSGGGGGIQTCSSLEADQCATDETGCVCAAATNCCKGFGCGTWKAGGHGTCLPCSWADGGAELLFTTDSCLTA